MGRRRRAADRRLSRRRHREYEPFWADYDALPRYDVDAERQWWMGDSNVVDEVHAARQARAFDWDWVTPQLATGGIPTSAAEMDHLVESGISVVINCATELRPLAEAVIASDRRIAYVANPIRDDYLPKPAAWFGVTIGAAVAAMAQDRRVLVHCIGGSNRGPSSAYAVLRALGHPHARALRLVRAARPQAILKYVPDARRAVEASGDA